MENHGMNYPLYNNFPYPHLIPQSRPTFLGQAYPRRQLQPRIAQCASYQMQSSPSTQPQYNNSYDHLIQSAAETLAAFTAPSEQTIVVGYPPPQLQTQHRFATNSNPTAKTSIHMYYCEICRIECGGHASYQAHIKGSKHVKRASNAPTSQKNASVFRCELCDITCTSSDAHQAHLDGSKHQKTVKLHLKLGKTIPEPTHPSADESQATADRNTKQSSQNSTPLIGSEYIETIYDNSHTIKSYFCKLCDCTFNDPNARDTHLKGKRHRLSYKRKVDPSLQVDNNKTKPASPKQSAANPTDSVQQRSTPLMQQPTEVDDGTRCLMTLHERIIPPQSLLDRIEQFVNTVEAALKQCSEQLSPPAESATPAADEAVANKSPLLGISRIGVLAKSLLIRSDRVFQVAVVCAEWPGEDLIQSVFALLTAIWSDCDDPCCYKNDETIHVYIDTPEGRMCVSISFTSLSTRPSHVNVKQETPPADVSLNAMYAMHSIRWFQRHVSTRQHAPALIRCLRYKTKVSRRWRSLPSEVIEILVDNTLATLPSPVAAFRRVLEYLAGGLLLTGDPSLRVPWQTNSAVSALDTLTKQERDDITHEAQIGLRLMAFGQLNSWFEQHDTLSPSSTPVHKRPLDETDKQVLVKRQRLHSEGFEQH